MSEPVIQSVRGRRIWDSRGRPTIEAEILLSDGAIGRGIPMQRNGRDDGVEMRAPSGLRPVVREFGEQIDALRRLDSGQQDDGKATRIELAVGG